jgi:hypothetical protein
MAGVTQIVLFAVGFLLLSVGIWLISPAASLITAGILCLATAFVWDFDSGQRKG